jgi:hypothetical protein
VASTVSGSLEDAFALTLLRDRAPEPAVAGVQTAGATPDALLRQAREHCGEAPRLRRLWSLRGWFTGRLPGPWLVAAAFCLGLAGAGLGRGGELNILTPPLLGLLGWQLVVFALLAAGALRRGRHRTTGTAIPAALATRITRHLGAVEAGDARRLAGDWFGRARAPLAARWAATLHLGAAAIALGAIAGLYLDGLGTAYLARWESTFLDASQVAVLARLVLGPASLVTGIPLPDADGFARLAGAGVPAAPWVHLWATTLLAAAVLPRCLLASVALRRGLERLPLDDDPWLRTRLAGASGRRVDVRVQPVGYRPGPRSHERLTEALVARFGAYAVTDRREPLRWDAEPSADAGADVGQEIVILVSAAQTPEEEVHGPLLDGFARAGADAGPLLVAVDTAAYAAERDRRRSRVAAWSRLAEAHGAEVLELEAD